MTLFATVTLNGLKNSKILKSNSNLYVTARNTYVLTEWIGLATAFTPVLILFNSLIECFVNKSLILTELIGLATAFIRVQAVN